MHHQHIHTELGSAVDTLERCTALSGAALVLAAGARRPTPMKLCIAAAMATPLAYRGFTGRWPMAPPRPVDTGDTRKALAGSSGVHVNESIRVERPLAEVYRFWRRLENLPSFMSHLERVTEYGPGRSRWVAKGPAGLRVEWEAEIINEVENDVIGWRSLPGSDVVVAGSVHFDAVRGGRSTQVTVHLQYEPPAGRAGAFFASLFGREPSQTVREDLRALKHVFEAGEVPLVAASDRAGAGR
jgi:uncharacterized membrane protein